MVEPFPGKDVISVEQETEFKRRAVERLWIRLRAAARAANPDCVIRLSCRDLGHPQPAGSRVFKEIDWLMNEAGDMECIDRARKMASEHSLGPAEVLVEGTALSLPWQFRLAKSQKLPHDDYLDGHLDCPAAPDSRCQ